MHDADTGRTTGDLLKSASETVELIGVPVDFAVRQCIEDSANRHAREHILSSAGCVYGS